jgi:membrane protein implicated in regulation of membrane protease activity
VIFQRKPSSTGQSEGQVPLLSFSRFGLGTIIMLSFLAVFSLILFYFKVYPLAITFALVAVAIFSVKSFENIQFRRDGGKKLIGQRCFVVKKIAPNERGIVRVYRDDGQLDPELWSAELVTLGQEIVENRTAIVVGMRSIILLVKPD